MPTVRASATRLVSTLPVLLVLVCAAPAVTSCGGSERGSITLQIDSNLGDRLVRLRLYTGGFGVMPGEPRIDRMAAASGPALVPGSILLEAPTDGSQDLFAWARGDLADGRSVTARAQMRFRAGQRRVELLYIASECLDPSALAACGTGPLTCSEGGRCVPVSRDEAPQPALDAGPRDAPSTDAAVTADAPALADTSIEVVECPAGRISCDATCVDPNSSTMHCGRCGQPCRPDQQCLNGGCACATGRANCGGTYCAELTSDAMNCGACGRACTAGQRCAAGTCQ